LNTALFKVSVPLMSSTALPRGKVHSVWERHPIQGVVEQPVHFVRRQTDQRKDVGAIGLEDSEEWHRTHYEQSMEGEPWDRALLLNSIKHHSDLQARFPKMKHYWEDPNAGFGEQIRLEGLDADNLCLGDELQSEYGPLRLKITCPRLCCFRVDHRYPAIPAIKYSGQPGTVRQYCSSTSHGGYFCKVLRPGSIMEGDEIKVCKRHFPQYPLAKLAGMVYGKTPLQVTFSGTDDELDELCNMKEDLCHFEWLNPITHYKDALSQSRPLQVHESLGTPVSYEEGKKNVAGQWMIGTGAKEIQLSWQDDKLVGDETVFDDLPCVGHPRNYEDHFAVEFDMGGFPHFPRFAYMTTSGCGRGILQLIFSHDKWMREPDVV